MFHKNCSSLLHSYTHSTTIANWIFIQHSSFESDHQWSQSLENSSHVVLHILPIIQIFYNTKSKRGNTSLTCGKLNKSKIPWNAWRQQQLAIIILCFFSACSDSFSRGREMWKKEWKKNSIHFCMWAHWQWAISMNNTKYNKKKFGVKHSNWISRHKSMVWNYIELWSRQSQVRIVEVLHYIASSFHIAGR